MTIQQPNDPVRYILNWGEGEDHAWFRFAPSFRGTDESRLLMLHVEVLEPVALDEVWKLIDDTKACTDFFFPGDLDELFEDGVDFSIGEAGNVEVRGRSATHRYEGYRVRDFISLMNLYEAPENLSPYVVDGERSRFREICQRRIAVFEAALQNRIETISENRLRRLETQLALYKRVAGEA